MAETDKNAALNELRKIPGVGVRIARDLYDLGYRNVGDLAGEDPREMYEVLTRKTGRYVDRCMLYVFRLAVYFAETPEPEPEKLKWWNWKDGGAALPLKEKSRQGVKKAGPQ